MGKNINLLALRAKKEKQKNRINLFIKEIK